MVTRLDKLGVRADGAQRRGWSAINLNGSCVECPQQVIFAYQNTGKTPPPSMADKCVIAGTAVSGGASDKDRYLHRHPCPPVKVRPIFDELYFID